MSEDIAPIFDEAKDGEKVLNVKQVLHYRIRHSLAHSLTQHSTPNTRPRTIMVRLLTHAYAARTGSNLKH